MKVIFLNKNEQEVLTKICSNLIRNGCVPYEVTTILEKISSGAYEYAFNSRLDNGNYPKQSKYICKYDICSYLLGEDLKFN